MAPMFDAREFRRSLAAFAAGVAIVTTTDGNGLRAWRHSRALNILPSTS
jgi:flavin reductase (DIM6/NTAB) family NADH-FMN oxidoreductase RutF